MAETLKPILNDSSDISTTPIGAILVDGVEVDIHNYSDLYGVTANRETPVTTGGMAGYLKYSSLREIMNAVLSEGELVSTGVLGGQLSIAHGNSVKPISALQDPTAFNTILQDGIQLIKPLYTHIRGITDHLNSLDYRNIELKDKFQLSDYISVLDFKYVKKHSETTEQLIKVGDTIELNINYIESADGATIDEQGVYNKMLTIVDSTLLTANFLLDINTERIVLYCLNPNISEYFISSAKIHDMPDFELNQFVTWNNDNVTWDGDPVQYQIIY